MQDYPSYNTMLLEIQDQIAIVKFNRPEALNAANIEMSHERLDLYTKLSQDENVRVVIITGNERAYCAGGDVEAFSKFNEEEAKEFAERGVKYQETLMNMPKPTIAAVSGLAFGGGFENVLLCDLRIASENAQFSLPEINLGIFPGGGGTQRLLQNVSISKAKELVFLAGRIDAVTARDLGIINRVVPAEQLMEEALLWAKELVKKPGLALASAKKLINEAWGTPIGVGMQREIEEWSRMYSTADQKEGMNAFLEKRKPNFKNQ